jgi:hypothetical protein
MRRVALRNGSLFVAMAPIVIATVAADGRVEPLRSGHRGTTNST